MDEHRHIHNRLANDIKSIVSFLCTLMWKCIIIVFRVNKLPTRALSCWVYAKFTQEGTCLENFLFLNPISRRFSKNKGFSGKFAFFSSKILFKKWYKYLGYYLTCCNKCAERYNDVQLICHKVLHLQSYLFSCIALMGLAWMKLSCTIYIVGCTFIDKSASWSGKEECATKRIYRQHTKAFDEK